MASELGFCVERVTRIELAWPAWQAEIEPSQPCVPHRPGSFQPCSLVVAREWQVLRHLVAPCVLPSESKYLRTCPLTEVLG
jgi:hypothetical protein